MRLIDADTIFKNNVVAIYQDDANKTAEEILEAIRNAPTVEAVPKSYADQIRWERDVAIEQLNEIGCQFGQKMDEVKEKLEALQWIPCSERLPEPFVKVLIFTDGGTFDVACMGYSYMDIYDIWKPVGGGYRKQENVIAWCPLPEPYQQT